MQINYDIALTDPDGPTCITTGTFDGVHIGHRKIIDRLKATANERGLESVLITFDPHPRTVIFHDSPPVKLLSTLDEKLELLGQTGIDRVIVHPFTIEFSRTPALNYVRDMLVGKLRMEVMVVGYDHQFGKNREGSIEQLREFSTVYGFEIVEIPPQEIDQVNVSSTKIRNALERGDVKTANRFLSYNYTVKTVVEKGEGRGKGLGFPTANLRPVHQHKLIPARGVYAVRVHLGNMKYGGMMNIGTNPTFASTGSLKLEVHIFGFSGILYGQYLTVEFVDRIRDEQYFSSGEELAAQLYRDQQLAKQLLK
ncbi:MAG: bifunctional riboflavin kinase/FAD synthetase [Salibacteraceae bacterium]